MANEIIVNATLKVTKGYLNVQQTVNSSITLNAAAPNVSAATQIISTTAAGTALTVGDVATLGWGWIQNLDAANYVEIGTQVAATFYPIIRLNFGEGCPVRFAQGVTLYARANTASVVLQKMIFDN